MIWLLKRCNFWTSSRMRVSSAAEGSMLRNVICSCMVVSRCCKGLLSISGVGLLLCRSGGQYPGQFQQRFVQRLGHTDHGCKRCRRDPAVYQAEQNSVLARTKALDRSLPEASRQKSIEGPGSTPALHVPEFRDAQIESQSLRMLVEVGRHPLGVVARTLGHDHDRVLLASVIGVMDLRGDAFR